ncbi:hypothetical protein ACJX0J_033652, partial [Zea mays]
MTIVASIIGVLAVPSGGINGVEDLLTLTAMVISRSNMLIGLLMLIGPLLENFLRYEYLMQEAFSTLIGDPMILSDAKQNPKIHGNLICINISLMTIAFIDESKKHTPP